MSCAPFQHSWDTGCPVEALHKDNMDGEGGNTDCACVGK